MEGKLAEKMMLQYNFTQHFYVVMPSVHLLSNSHEYGNNVSIYNPKNICTYRWEGVRLPSKPMVTFSEPLKICRNRPLNIFAGSLRNVKGGLQDDLMSLSTSLFKIRFNSSEWNLFFQGYLNCTRSTSKRSISNFAFSSCFSNLMKINSIS